MRAFLLGVAGFFVALAATLVAYSSYGDYAARASLADTLAGVEPLRLAIAEALQAQGGKGPLPAEILTPPAVAGADVLRVGADGTIVVRSAKHGQIVVLVPEFHGAVSWKCIGAPRKDVPPDCR